jgi:hypothetical protein
MQMIDQESWETNYVTVVCADHEVRILVSVIDVTLQGNESEKRFTMVEAQKPGLENRDYGRRDPLRWPRDTYQLKLALTSPKGCGHSFGIVRLRTETTGFSFLQAQKRW